MLSGPRRDELDQWIRAVLPRAVAYARSLLRDRSRAEDVVQECLYRLLRRGEAYDLPRDGLPLLFRAITNLCINQTTRERSLASLDTGGADQESLPVEDRFTPRPEDVASSRELQAALDRALAKLPPLQRAALELRALGQGKEEIAAALEVSPTNAGVLVHRARQALATELQGWARPPRDSV